MKYQYKFGFAHFLLGKSGEIWGNLEKSGEIWTEMAIVAMCSRRNPDGEI